MAVRKKELFERSLHGWTIPPAPAQTVLPSPYIRTAHLSAIARSAFLVNMPSFTPLRSFYTLAPSNPKSCQPSIKKIRNQIKEIKDRGIVYNHGRSMKMDFFIFIEGFYLAGFKEAFFPGKDVPF